MDKFVELEAACEGYREAVKMERAVVRRLEEVLLKCGEAREHERILRRELARASRVGIDTASPFAVSAASVEIVAAKRKAVEDQQALGTALDNGLATLHGMRQQAAEATARAASTLRKQALDLFEARNGKRALFSVWSDDLEQTYAWRRGVLGQLLAFTSGDAEHVCALLMCFFRQKEFLLHVRRGFRISTDAGLRDIVPGAGYAVPGDLSYQAAFEGILAGRAELASNRVDC